MPHHAQRTLHLLELDPEHRRLLPTLHLLPGQRNRAVGGHLLHLPQGRRQLRGQELQLRLSLLRSRLIREE